MYLLYIIVWPPCFKMVAQCVV